MRIDKTTKVKMVNFFCAMCVFVACMLVLRNMFLGCDIVIMLGEAGVVLICVGLILKQNEQLKTPDEVRRDEKAYGSVRGRGYLKNIPEEKLSSFEKLVVKYPFISRDFVAKATVIFGSDNWTPACSESIIQHDMVYHVLYERYVNGSLYGVEITDAVFIDGTWFPVSRNYIGNIDSDRVIGMKELGRASSGAKHEGENSK